jgi:hypothetical protein
MIEIERASRQSFNLLTCGVLGSRMLLTIDVSVSKQLVSATSHASDWTTKKLGIIL